MKHELIIKRDDGSKVKIEIKLFVHFMRDDGEPEYRVSVFSKDKGRRKWEYNHTLLDCHALVTKEDVLKAKLELWEKIKPKTGN